MTNHHTPIRSEIAESVNGPDPDDETEWEKCDGCEEEFDREDMYNHSDGNVYCSECVYMTDEDRRDGEADDARDDV